MIEANVDAAGALTLTVGKHSTVIAPATDTNAVDTAIGILLERLAGVSRHELTMAAFRAVHPEYAK